MNRVKRIKDLEATLGDLLFHAALAKARQAGREHFAETLLAHLPPGPSPEQLWFDESALEPHEWGLLLEPRVREYIDGLSPAELWALARGEAEVQRHA